MPECSSEVSSQTNTCPKCGFPIKRELRKSKRKEVLEEKKVVVTSALSSVKKYIFPILHLIVFLIVIGIFFELPIKKYDSPSAYSLYNEEKPTTCNRELALEHNINDYDPLTDINNTRYAFFAESFAYSGSTEQTEAIKCEIWKEFHMVSMISKNELKAKFAILIAVTLDPVIIVPLMICWLICFFNKNLTTFSTLVSFTFVAALFGSFSEGILSSMQFYRPTELTVNRAFAVAALSLLLSITMHLKKHKAK